MKNTCTEIVPAIYPKAKRIVAIGDIHGDYNSLLQIFTHAKILKNNKFVARDTHIVIVGDFLDRGARRLNADDERSEYKIIKLLFKMMHAAKKYNSHVCICLGNHEIMNVLGDFSYVSPEGNKDFDGRRHEYMKPGGKIAKLLACKTNTIVKIGSWLFSHAGVKSEISNKYKLTEVNHIIREFLLGNTEYPVRPIFKRLFWHRSFGGRKPNCEDSNKSAGNYNTVRQVIGHTVQRSGINVACDEKLFRIDVGLSRAFYKNPRIQYLEIINDDNYYLHKL